MASGKQIAGVFIAVTIAAVVLLPINSVVSGSTGDISVDNETISSATVGNSYDLKGYDVYDTETVYWYNSSTSSYETLTEGTDYNFSYDTGEITLLSGGSVSDGDEVKVNYEYKATTSTVTTVATLTPLLVALLILVRLSQPIMRQM